MADSIDFDRMTCPTPLNTYEHVLLGHGSGGKLTADLIQQVFLPELGNDVLSRLEDQATVHLARHGENGRKTPRLAFTTDSFVVRPLFFPGGDIGRLAVHGTVNDLAVEARRPSFCRPPLSLKRACRWTTCGGSLPPSAKPVRRRTCNS